MTILSSNRIIKEPEKETEIWQYNPPIETEQKKEIKKSTRSCLPPRKEKGLSHRRQKSIGFWSSGTWCAYRRKPTRFLKRSRRNA